MGRSRLSTRRLVTIRVPEVEYAELILLRPDLQDLQGYTKYGAISGYFVDLMRHDLARQKAAIRAAATQEVIPLLLRPQAG